MLEIIEKSKERIKFKLIGKRHTLPELLKKQLLENKDVIMASYLLEHPEDPDSIFLIKVNKGKDAKTILLKAIEELKTEFKDFETQATKSLK